MSDFRVWCGLCGTYVYQGQEFPCGSPSSQCGALGKPTERLEEPAAQLDLFTMQKQHHQGREVVTGSAFEFAKSVQATNAPVTARESQVGGDHYRTMAIQPFEYSLGNNLDACQHTAIKYVTRWREKGGIKDIDKAIHTLQFYKEWLIENGFAGDYNA